MLKEFGLINVLFILGIWEMALIKSFPLDNLVQNLRVTV